MSFKMRLKQRMGIGVFSAVGDDKLKFFGLAFEKYIEITAKLVIWGNF